MFCYLNITYPLSGTGTYIPSQLESHAHRFFVFCFFETAMLEDWPISILKNKQFIITLISWNIYSTWMNAFTFFFVLYGCGLYYSIISTSAGNQWKRFLHTICKGYNEDLLVKVRLFFNYLVLVRSLNIGKYWFQMVLRIFLAKENIEMQEEIPIWQKIWSGKKKTLDLWEILTHVHYKNRW